MAKKYFVNRRKNSRDTSLFKIIFALAALAGGLYLSGQAVGYLRSWAAAAPAGQEVAPDAPARDWITEARTALDGGEPEQAAALLAEWRAALGTESRLPLDAVVLESELAARSGSPADAVALLEPALESARNTADYPVAALALAKAYQAQGEDEKATALYTEVRDRAPSPYREAGMVALAEAARAEGPSADSLEVFEQVLAKAEPNSEPWNQALDALSAMNVELIFSPAETPDCRYYVIEAGDSITSIGNSLNTTQGLLMRANSITAPERIRVGQRLKYTPKDFRIVIERSTCRLFLLDTAGIFKRYYVGLGMPGYETALGKYTIGNKQKDPTWFKPGAGPVPPNDPENELGTRWMPLIPLDAGLPTDLGIHGTIAPESIGKYESHGCPRLKREDVEELYDLVVRSTPVEIVDTIDWPSLLSTPASGGVAS